MVYFVSLLILYLITQALGANIYIYTELDVFIQTKSS